MHTSSTSTRRRRRKPRRAPPPPPTTSSPPTPSSPYLTPEEAARYLRYSTVHALRQATKTMGIPCIRRGRRIF
ncbi:hypothetical protein, partial [Salmonella sp. SAL4432]|uniref:hypothetical protein n=1 Tax=Salmonella sp. SAL4432 TaxID=3159887 RepID=UPI00397BE619